MDIIEIIEIAEITEVGVMVVIDNIIEIILEMEMTSIKREVDFRGIIDRYHLLLYIIIVHSNLINILLLLFYFI